MRLRDADGTAHELTVAAGRTLRIRVCTAPDAAETLARAVHADVVRRVAERAGATVSVHTAGPHPPDADSLVALGCRPHGEPEEPVDVAVGGPAGGAAEWHPHGTVGSVDLAGRLALLARTDEAAAREQVRRWRAAVAQWAEHPSRPMCADYLGWTDEALADGPDVGRVVALLGEVEAHAELPAGSKFELFAHLDQVLALDLAGEVGLSR